jgi:hypothetical protein
MSMVRTLEALALVLTCGLLAPMCLPPPDGCTPTATRCNGQVAEVCDGATRWSKVMDCAQVAAQSGGAWVCCAVMPDAGTAPDAGIVPDHVCVPKSECPGGAS